MPKLILSVSLDEKEWRLINNCMEFTRDNADLCSDCMEYLFEIHQKMYDQLIEQLESEVKNLS